MLRAWVREDPHGTVVVLVGELDLASAPMLTSLLEALGTDQQSRLVMDLANLDFMDCAGLSALLRARRRATENGGRLRIGAPGPLVRKVLRITRLEEHLRCFPSVTAALAAPNTGADAPLPVSAVRNRLRPRQPASPPQYAAVVGHLGPSTAYGELPYEGQ